MFVDALQPSLIKGIFTTVGPYSDQSLSDLVTSRRGAYGVAFDSSMRCFDLGFGGYEHVTHAIASDCRRLAISSWQTTHQLWATEED